MADLDPYFCLCEDCHQPNKLYSDKDDWISHLREHTRSWFCSSHPGEYRF